jgi:ribosome-binding protein aMBF1 (putative translation factor)
LEKSIPIGVFNQAYPEKPQTFGETLRKARIDAGLQIKELAQELGVDEMSVINWELKGMKPTKRNASAMPL